MFISQDFNSLYNSHSYLFCYDSFSKFYSELAWLSAVASVAINYTNLKKKNPQKLSDLLNNFVSNSSPIQIHKQGNNNDENQYPQQHTKNNRPTCAIFT